MDIPSLPPKNPRYSDNIGKRKREERLSLPLLLSLLSLSLENI